MSGAIIAVESDFEGVIWDVEPGQDAKINVTKDTKSTFFILLIGSKNEIVQYSEKLFKEFEAKAIPFTNTLFLIDSGETEKILLKPSAKSVNAKNKRQFESPDNQFALVNLRQPASSRHLGLYEWEGGNAVSSNVEAYQVWTKIGSQYSGEVAAVMYSGGNFEYPIDYTIDFFEGGKKPRPGEVSAFRQYRKNDLFTVTANANEASGSSAAPLYLQVKTSDNKKINSGFYKIASTITTKAVLPKWITDKNAEDYAALGNSVSSDTVIKVLGLRKVYSDIVETYNRNKNRPAWFVELYLVKRR